MLGFTRAIVFDHSQIVQSDIYIYFTEQFAFLLNRQSVQSIYLSFHSLVTSQCSVTVTLAAIVAQLRSMIIVVFSPVPMTVCVMNKATLQIMSSQTEDVEVCYMFVQCITSYVITPLTTYTWSITCVADL